MAFATIADRDAIENEKPWEDRAKPVTTFEMLTNTAAKFGTRKATSFSLLSDPSAPCETLDWNALRDKTAEETVFGAYLRIRHGVRPAKAGLFSGRQSHRGRSQRPVA